MFSYYNTSCSLPRQSSWRLDVGRCNTGVYSALTHVCDSAESPRSCMTRKEIFQQRSNWLCVVFGGAQSLHDRLCRSPGGAIFSVLVACHICQLCRQGGSQEMVPLCSEFIWVKRKTDDIWGKVVCSSAFILRFSGFWPVSGQMGDRAWVTTSPSSCFGTPKMRSWHFKSNKTYRDDELMTILKDEANTIKTRSNNDAT